MIVVSASEEEETLGLRQKGIIHENFKRATPPGA
jgi:hypothetical protein